MKALNLSGAWLSLVITLSVFASCVPATKRADGFVVNLQKLNKGLEPEDIDRLFGSGGFRDTSEGGSIFDLTVAPAYVLGIPASAHFMFENRRLREVWFLMRYNLEGRPNTSELKLMREGGIGASRSLFDSITGLLASRIGQPKDTSFVEPGYQIISFSNPKLHEYLQCSFEPQKTSFSQPSIDTTKGVIMLHPFLRYFD